MSQVDRSSVSAPEELEDLPAEDRAWLAERLTEYQELLLYLHDR
jgi:hypothetical protein